MTRAILAGLALAASCGKPADRSGDAAARPVDVAVFPVALQGSTDASLRAIAESGAALLVQRLAAETIAAVLRAPNEPVDAPFALRGTLKVDNGQYSVELDLLDGRTGDELHAYFNSGTTPSILLELADKGAPRIALRIREARNPPQQ